MAKVEVDIGTHIMHVDDTPLGKGVIRTVTLRPTSFRNIASIKFQLYEDGSLGAKVYNEFSGEVGVDLGSPSIMLEIMEGFIVVNNNRSLRARTGSPDLSDPVEDGS